MNHWYLLPFSNLILLFTNGIGTVYESGNLLDVVEWVVLSDIFH